MLGPIYLGLGSNLGDRNGYISEAIAMLNAHEFIEVGAVSEMIETVPEGPLKQPFFLNAACEVSSFLSPQELLLATQEIEVHLGRTRKGTYDPRTIDIDILLMGDLLVSDDDLVVPHPMMHTRSFVLKPLLDIAAQVKHPLFQKTIQEIYNEYQRFST
ncbi:MAG: 2-amino-4-hydroxy-6-hydroxymethyldihydropteridine diphosphokinase [Actinobacteria bacterium]|nr:2-amino-4-hydroxy-6-hydroxymethyldihydropteridine diphosphokinase [Actinomycetota bacterium]